MPKGVTITFANDQTALDALDKVLALEYEKIASKERIERLKIENEYKIAQLKSEPKTIVKEIKKEVKSEPEEEISNEDQEFNQLTGFDMISTVSAGKISKTNLTPVLRTISAKLEGEWDDIKRKSLKSKDANSNRIRTLIATFLMASMAEARYDFWPNAPDSTMINQIKEDTLVKLKQYDKEVIIPTFEFLKEYFKENYSGTPIEDLKTSLYGSYLDELYSRMEKLEEMKETYDIGNSPLAKAMSHETEHIDPAIVKQMQEYYFAENLRAGADGFAGAVAHYSKEYPHPDYLEESKKYDNWEQAYNRSISSKIMQRVFMTGLDEYNAHMSAQKKWLEDRKKFLEMA